jgi:DNA oxidative demethylase
MRKIHDLHTVPLFSPVARADARVEPLTEGAVILRAFAVREAAGLLQSLCKVLAVAPFRHMVTPGGYRMSVAMTNCGCVGWVTDRSGYRYAPVDPTTQRRWPALPRSFLDLAARAAAAGGFEGFVPDSCLINHYAPGAQLSLHQDKNEQNFSAPIVSMSLGLPAVFLFGGLRRSDRARRLWLESGDVAIWGGPARLVFHGVAPLSDGIDPLTGRCRINLTFRKAL